jgi:hypothetical protein
MATKITRTSTSNTQFVRLVTKRQLVEAQKNAGRWNFNRQIDPKLDLSALGDFKFPVTFSMPHYHRRMRRCEEHRRILVFIPEFAWVRETDLSLLTDPHHLLFDVPMKYFDKLGQKKLPRTA